MGGFYMQYLESKLPIAQSTLGAFLSFTDCALQCTFNKTQIHLREIHFSFP